MAKEYLDIRRKDGSLTGETKERTLVHRDGDLHGTVHIFILRQGAEGWEMLLQKRSENKDAFPGCYDISSAGHVSAGQEYGEAALRELEEELGISATQQELQFVGYYTFYWEENFYGEPFRNHEISAVYIYTEPVSLETLQLQEEEVASVCWLPLETCQAKAAANDPQYCLMEEELEMIKKWLHANA